MTPAQATDFIKKYPGALNFVKRSHLEELSPLFECHVEAIEVRKDEFHDLKGSFMPRKETLDKFAQAAGVSFNQTADTTRMEGEGCYVGTAQAMTMGPDGKWILGPICEYEFDCSIRLEEMKLAGKTEWVNGQKQPPRDYTEKELAQERVQFRKVGRQRANTGARSRATLSVLGMQTGFKDLFAKGTASTATKVFLFSRVIVNAKNEMVLNRMLDNIAGPVSQLYGNSPATAQIAAPTSYSAAPYEGLDPEDPPMRPVEDAETTPASLASQAAAPDDGFDSEPATEEDPRRVNAVLVLEEFLTSDKLTVSNKNYIKWMLDNPKSEKSTIEQLELYIKKCQGVMQRAAS